MNNPPPPVTGSNRFVSLISNYCLTELEKPDAPRLIHCDYSSATSCFAFCLVCDERVSFDQRLIYDVPDQKVAMIKRV